LQEGVLHSMACEVSRICSIRLGKEVPSGTRARRNISMKRFGELSDARVGQRRASHRKCSFVTNLKRIALVLKNEIMRIYGGKRKGVVSKKLFPRVNHNLDHPVKGMPLATDQRRGGYRWGRMFHAFLMRQSVHEGL